MPKECIAPTREKLYEQVWSPIMQTLLAAFDRRGFAIRVTEKNETFVTVLGEAFQIALIERLKQVRVKHTPTAPASIWNRRVGGC